MGIIKNMGSGEEKQETGKKVVLDGFQGGKPESEGEALGQGAGADPLSPMSLLPAAFPDGIAQAGSPSFGSGYARLPAFAALCAAVARKIALRDPYLWASRAQKSWHLAAEKTLGAMSRHGACLEGFVFIAHDERELGKVVERVLAKNSFIEEREALAWWPDGGAVATGVSVFGSDGSTRFVGSSHEAGEAKSFVDELGYMMGSRQRARSYIVGHEWAHCWQAKHAYPLGAAASTASGTPLAQEGLEFIEGFKSRATLTEGSKSFKTEAFSALKWVEEAFCDVVGCWAVERMDGVQVSEHVAAYRDVLQKRGECPSFYDTSRLIRAVLPKGSPAPRTFQELFEQALKTMPKAAEAVFVDGPKKERCLYDANRAVL